MASAERVMYIIDEESNITNPISPIFINDIKNSLKYLNDGGYIIIHDCV